MRKRLLPLSLLAVFCLSAQAPPKSVNPAVERIVSEVSEANIAATQKKLETFETRNIYSTQNDPIHGIGAARRWIEAQFQSFSPRLQVSFDKHGIKAHGRASRDVEIYNVVAVLPGTTAPERHVIISGHYDSIHVVYKTDAAGHRTFDPGATIAAYAPGVTDDGSGTAAVLELARVMSQYKFRKTIVFIAFAGEEYGLFGSATYAQEARNRGDVIEGVLNNDIIGCDIRGDGSKGNRRVNVYSEDPDDSTSRQLARYVRETGERYLPGMDVNLVFRHDRFGRGGDHSPFNAYGYAAVRLTTPYEDYANQHTADDTFANTSPPYTTMVARINASALASLALAPQPPELAGIPAAPGSSFVMPLGRGKTGYNAEMHWKANPEADLAGYAIVMRKTSSPYWEHYIYVGNVTSYTLPGVDIDEVVLGVKAIDKDGNESLVSAYVNPPYRLPKIETY